MNRQSPDRDAAADGAVQHRRGLFDPVGRGVERIGDRGLRRPGAFRRHRADVAQRFELPAKRASRSYTTLTCRKPTQETSPRTKRLRSGSAFSASSAGREMSRKSPEWPGKLERPPRN